MFFREPKGSLTFFYTKEVRMFRCPRCKEEVPDSSIFEHVWAHKIQDQLDGMRYSHPEIHEDKLELGDETGG